MGHTLNAASYDGTPNGKYSGTVTQVIPSSELPPSHGALAVRKNHETGEYEVFDTATDVPEYTSSSLADIAEWLTNHPATQDTFEANRF